MIDALTQEIGIEAATHLIKGLLSFPLMLVDEDLVGLAVQPEELFLVLVRQLADVSMCVFTIRPEPELVASHSNEVCVRREPYTVLLQWIVLPGLLIVVHLDARVVLFD